ncbi:MAG: hypothetical protein R6X29_04335 [Acidimicrobiia bacterium]
MVESVAVVSSIAALRLGLVSMLAGTRFFPEVPTNPGCWLDGDGHRLLHLAVAEPRDLSLVVDLRRAEAPVAVVLLPELSAPRPPGRPGRCGLHRRLGCRPRSRFISKAVLVGSWPASGSRS